MKNFVILFMITITVELTTKEAMMRKKLRFIETDQFKPVIHAAADQLHWQL